MKEAMEWLLPREGDRLRYFGGPHSYLKYGHDYLINKMFPFDITDTIQKSTGAPLMSVSEVPKRDAHPAAPLFTGKVYHVGLYPVCATRRFIPPKVRNTRMKGELIRADQYQVQSTFIVSMPWLPEPQKREGDPEDYNMIFLSES